MRRLFIFFAVVIGLVVAGGAFLASWDIPPPEGPIEKTIPDDRLPR